MSYAGNDADQDFISRLRCPPSSARRLSRPRPSRRCCSNLEEQPDDRELLDSLFSCAHTVKGSAGIFGLNKVVEFTHHVETLLDQHARWVIVLDARTSAPCCCVQRPDQAACGHGFG
jgi:hypothetical protein